MAHVLATFTPPRQPQKAPLSLHLQALQVILSCGAESEVISDPP